MKISIVGLPVAKVLAHLYYRAMQSEIGEIHHSDQKIMVAGFIDAAQELIKKSLNSELPYDVAVFFYSVNLGLGECLLDVSLRGPDFNPTWFDMRYGEGSAERVILDVCKETRLEVEKEIENGIKGMSLTPDPAEYSKIGDLYRELGDITGLDWLYYAEACNYYTRAISLEKSPLSYINRAMVLAKTCQPDLAVSDLMLVLEGYWYSTHSTFQDCIPGIRELINMDSVVDAIRECIEKDAIDAGRTLKCIDEHAAEISKYKDLMASLKAVFKPATPVLVSPARHLMLSAGKQPNGESSGFHGKRQDLSSASVGGEGWELVASPQESDVNDTLDWELVDSLDNKPRL